MAKGQVIGGIAKYIDLKFKYHEAKNQQRFEKLLSAVTAVGESVKGRNTDICELRNAAEEMVMKTRLSEGVSAIKDFLGIPLTSVLAFHLIVEDPEKKADLRRYIAQTVSNKDGLYATNFCEEFWHPDLYGRLVYTDKVQ